MLRAKRRTTTHIGLVLLVCVLVVLAAVNIHYELLPVHFCTCEGCDGGGIRVLSYNVHSLSDGFTSSAPKMAWMILEEEPDFVYLTEYYEGTDETLQEALEQHYPNINREHRWGANEGDAFYSTWGIDSVYRFTLSGHHSAIYRVQIHKKADTLAVYCCHLSSNNLKIEEGRWASLEEGRRLRCEEACVIVEALNNERYPAIVMGDMNDLSYSQPIKMIEATSMRDAWWKGGLGYGSTYSENWLKLRIDHVLYDKKKLKLHRVGVIGDYKFSDHRSIVADMELKPN